MDEKNAQEALVAIRAVQGRMARRARWSLARHAAFGVAMGGLVASYALPFRQALGGLALCLLLAAAIARWDRRRDGFFINGYRAGATRPITIAIGLFTMAALIVAIAFKERWSWSPLFAGLVVLVAATLGSIAWERAYRRELESGHR